MGSLDRGIYLPAFGETGWDDEANLNFNRLADVGVNVKAYGATGDGVTDDTVTIQAAIDSLGTSGGTVFFPSGVYVISDTIQVGHATGSHTGEANGLRLYGAGGLGTHPNNSQGVAWLKWAGASGTGPMMRVENVAATTIDGINFSGDRLASRLLEIEFRAGEQNPHNILVASCVFRGAQEYSTVVGNNTVAAGSTADICNLTYFRCHFNHAAVAGTNARAHVRGTSMNSLPINFISCEFAGSYGDGGIPGSFAGMDYHFELTGGTYNISGCLTTGAHVSAILYNVDKIDGVSQVPPNVNIYGVESQGDYSFLQFAYTGDRTTASAQRQTTLTGVFIGPQGSDPQHDDAIQWDEVGWAVLTLTGVRMGKNLNVVSATSAVFVHGLMFTDSSGSIVGNLDRVSGDWFDGSLQSAGLFISQAAVTLKTGANITAARPSATLVRAGAMWYDTTLHKPIWSDGGGWRDAAGTGV